MTTKMSYKKFSVSWPQWVFDQYLSDIKSNKSAFIVDNFVAGCEAKLTGNNSSKSQMLQLMQKVKSLEENNKQLTFQNASLKDKVSRRVEKDNLKRAKAMSQTAHKILLETLEEGDRR
jgi:hypothetical protein